MKFHVVIDYEVTTDNVIKGKEQVEAIVRAVGFKNFTVTHVDKQRTLNQNSAMHKWFEMIEEHCQERGLTRDVLFKNPAELPITKHMLKDFFRMVGNMMFHRKSTAELEKGEIDPVIKVCEREFAKRLDSTIPFPSIDNP